MNRELDQNEKDEDYNVTKLKEILVTGEGYKIEFKV